MSYPKNYIKNCNIYNKALWDDLKPYSIVDTVLPENIFKLQYIDPADNISVGTVKSSEIKNILNSNKPTLVEPNLEDIWLPAIISNDNYILNKEVVLGNVIGSKILGIEEVIKFDNIKLKNWTIGSGKLDLCLDWIINTNLSAYDIEYGVMFWYKKNTFHKSSTKYYFHQISSGIKIKPAQDLSYTVGGSSYNIPANTVIIKLDNNTISLLDKDSSRFESIQGQQDTVTGKFVFNTSQEHEIIPTSSILNIGSQLFYISENENTISADMADYDIWLSYGEFYSYFLGGKDKYDRQEYSTTKMPSRSYISPSVYHIYRAIYNSLTINRIKGLSGLGPTYSLEKLKKLCYILATSPLIDRVTINYLQDSQVQDIVHQYINANSKTSISEEITEILDVIAKIFIRYKQMSLFIQKQTLGGNYINNRQDLFKNLCNKYGAYLKIQGNNPTTIKYNKQISVGSQGYLDIQNRSFISKTILPETDIFNDIRIDFGKLHVDTQMNPVLSPSGCLVKIGTSIQSSAGNIQPKILPLSNMAIKKTPDKLLTSFNKDVRVELRNPGEILKIDGLVELTQPDLNEELEERVSYSWSLVDGPDCIRFSDFTTNREKDVQRKNRTSADSDPSLYIQQTGLYVIQGVTSFGSALKSIENIRLYVHDSSNEYEPGRTVPGNNWVFHSEISKQLQYYSHPPETKPKEYKPMCANLRQIAFNRNGLVWFVDSDMFICDRSYPAFPRDRRLVDQKINMALDKVQIPMLPIPDSELTKLTEPADVILTFKPNNTTIKLSHIKIEHMRDATSEHSQCKSFYEPKLARQRDSGTGVQTGAARFYRINKSPSSVDVLDHELVDNTFWRRNKLVSFELPDVSTVNTPPVSSYGGYSQSVIENIGIEIPFHPIKVNNQTLYYKKIPAKTYWNTSQENPTSAESGPIASAPAAMENLASHNYMGGTDPSIRCHTVTIPITGYTVFDKGFFHPGSGWYSYEASRYNPNGFSTYRHISETLDPNITAIKKFKTEKYKSYQFEGAGFYDLRSSNTMSSDTVNYNNSPMVYKSAIEIIPYSGYNKIWNDQDPNYGIRNWNGINYKDQELTDDFVIIKDREVPADFYCDYTSVNQYILKDDQTFENLEIEDIELKLNYINMANLKNIVFALEVYHPELDSIMSEQSQENKNKIFVSFGNNVDRTQDPSESWLSKVGVESLSDAPVLSFIKKLKETHTSENKVNTRTVYLYNQEGIDNYSYNFSLTFSDNFSKMHTFIDENKISVSGVGIYNKPIKSSNIIAPCISPIGYSEKQSVLFRQIMKNNNIHLLENSLAQFRKLPLKYSKFTLKVYVLGPEENVSSLDNTVLSSYLSGLSSYDVKESSNTIANSICSWNMIIHTSKCSKFTTQDYLGSIDYESDKIAMRGYNFIADMTDKEYLIPKVNINAPYDYISTNVCDYINNEELSRPFTYDRIQFPFVGFYVPTFFTLVGALVDISIILMKLGMGGRSDPIINMLLDIRFQRQQQEQERYYFKPVYNGAYIGVPGKALIQASKDKHSWYRMEVPIFKYSNIAVLSKNKYKYIKLHKDIATGLSNFYFEKVSSLDQLVNIDNISYTTTGNIADLTGLSVTVTGSSVPLNFNEYDIVRVAAQTNNDENGLYYVKTGAWVRYSLLSPRSLLNNKIFDNNTINVTNISAGKVIMIKGSRAYNLFDIGDQIVVMKEPAAKVSGQDLFTHTISNKALINLSTEQVTIITLSESLSGGITNGFISKDLESSNWVIIFKDHATYLEETILGKWGVSKTNSDKNHINNDISNQHSVATSEGAIGYGSNKLQPETYSHINISHPNKILDTEEMFNNHVNDKLKFNNITAIQYRDNTIKEISFNHTDPQGSLLRAYPYRPEDMEYSINSLNDYSLMFSSGLSIGANNTLVFTSGVPLSGFKLENMKYLLKNSLEKNNENYYFIDLKSDKFKTEITSVSGELIIENDFIKKIPHQYILEPDLTRLKTRLQNLTKKSDPPPKTNEINLETISSIPDLENFYNSLSVDPSGCFKKGYYTSEQQKINCSGYVAKNKLISLLEEKKQIIEALQLRDNIGSGVMPYTETELYESPTTKAITIKKKIKNHYILNIDPDQVCTLSNDATIKILTKVTHACEPIVELYDYPECDSVCKEANIDFGTDESLKTTYTATAAKLEYSNSKIEQEKAKYPGVVWDTGNPISINKTFFLSCEDLPRETLVKVTEEYITPLQTIPKVGLVKNIFNLDNNSQIFIKFRNIPRKIKTIDPNYTRYLYDYYGRLGEDIIPPPGGPIYNDFYAWQCIKVRANDTDPYEDKQYGEFVEPPAFYKFMNEMIFRGFFGSVDGIENKNTDIMDSKEPYEWIPYEYFGKNYYFNPTDSINTQRFNAQSDGGADWNNPDNWYYDKNFTKPANSIPTSFDSVELRGNVRISSGVGASVARLVCYDNSGIEDIYISARQAAFNDKSYNNGYINGDAIFNNYSVNLKKIFGNVIFNGNSRNAGEIIGFEDIFDEKLGGTVRKITKTCIFNNESYNSNFVESNTTFKDSSSNIRGDLRGFATFNDSARSEEGTLVGSIVFNDKALSYKDKIIDGTVTFNGNSYSNDIKGQTLFYKDNALSKGTATASLCLFESSSENWSDLTALRIKFKDNSTNKGVLEAKYVIFSDSSTNNSMISSDVVIFNNSAANLGIVEGATYLLPGTTNFGTLKGASVFIGAINEKNAQASGKVYFYKGSVNKGFLIGQAHYSPSSKNERLGGSEITIIISEIEEKDIPNPDDY